MSSLIISDRVVETSTTTGTGALTLAGAVTGYRAFSAAMSVGDTCYYTIEAIDSSGNPTGDWETGLGTYSAASTLTRTTVRASSNAGAAVSFAAGAKRVFLNMIASAVIPVASDGSATITGPGITLRYTSSSSGFTITDRSDSPGHQVNFVSNAAVTGGGAVMNIFAAASSATSKNISQISMWTVNPLTEVSSVQAAVRGVAGTSGEELHLLTQRFGTTALTAGDILFKPNATERFRVTSAGATVTGDLTATGNVTVADDAYDATTWNGSTQVPTKNAVRDKIEALAGGTGALVLLEQHTAAASASLDFTTAISATYDEYVIELVSIVPATNAVSLYLRMSTDGGATYDAGANYSGTVAATNRFGQAQSGTDSGATQIPLNQSLLSNIAAGCGISGSIRLFGPSSTAQHKRINGIAVLLASDGTSVESEQMSGVYRSITAVNAFRFLMSAGNIASGTIRVYGIAK